MKKEKLVKFRDHEEDNIMEESVQFVEVKEDFNNPYYSWSVSNFGATLQNFGHFVSDNKTIMYTSVSSKLEEIFQDGKLRMLKDDVMSKNSILTIPPIENSSNGWTATIDFQIGGAPPPSIADGFSFNYSSLSYEDQMGENATIGVGEKSPLDGGLNNNVFETGLHFSIRTWPQEGNNGFHIQYSEEIGEAEPVLFQQAEVFEDPPDLNQYKLLNATLIIAWHPERGVIANTTGLDNNLIMETPLPTPDFTGGDNYTFSIAARTGGAFMDLFIDNIKITVNEFKDTTPNSTGSENIPQGSGSENIPQGSGSENIEFVSNNLNQLTNSLSMLSNMYPQQSIKNLIENMIQSVNSTELNNL